MVFDPIAAQRPGDGKESMDELERFVQRKPMEIAQRITERCKTSGSRSIFALRRELVTNSAHNAYGIYAFCYPLVHHFPQALRSSQCFALEITLFIAAYK
jgi:hypothetical protein